MIAYLDGQIQEIHSQLFTLDDDDFKRIESEAARAVNDQSGWHRKRIGTGTNFGNKWICEL